MAILETEADLEFLKTAYIDENDNAVCEFEGKTYHMLEWSNYVLGPFDCFSEDMQKAIGWCMCESDWTRGGGGPGGESEVLVVIRPVGNVDCRDDIICAYHVDTEPEELKTKRIEIWHAGEDPDEYKYR